MKTQWNPVEKKQLLIYALTAFALPYALGILMGFAFYAGNDVSLFPNAQMFYPAAGVMLAMLLTRGKDPLLPKRFYVSFLVLTVLLLLAALGSVFWPSLSWALALNLILVFGSVVCWIFYFLDSKEKRMAYGLRFTGHGKRKPLLYVLLFLALYLGRIFLPALLTGDMASLAQILLDPSRWLLFAVLIPNFFFIFSAFFGEEYGWRGFLQPLLQKRFGPISGVLLLGVLWGLWHLPINLFYYAPDTPLQSILAQQITCITLSVFFAFAYQKTQNIWVPVLMHYFNNNMVAVIADASAIQDQVITWPALLIALLSAAVFYLPFLLSRVFRDPSCAAPLLPGEEEAYAKKEENLPE